MAAQLARDALLCNEELGDENTSASQLCFRSHGASGRMCPSVVNMYWWNRRLTGLSTSKSKYKYLHVSERKKDSILSSSVMSKTEWTVA